MVKKLNERHLNVVLILLALSFFLGATVQYSEGSNKIGLLLFIISLWLLSRLKIVKFVRGKPRYGLLYLIAGLSIILLDLGYNLLGLGRGGINTLDTMLILLGASLMGLGSEKEELRKLETFGAVMSGTFILLYITFYIALNHQLYKFDHYFVMLPSAYLIKALGVPIEIVGTETLRIAGGSDLVVKIGGPCSGLYSMFLLIGIVLGYSVTEGTGDN